MPPKRPKPDFIIFLEETLAPMEGIEAKRMFGGFGLFKDGLMFGLIADDVLYLKVDSKNKPNFDALDLEPFSYSRGDKTFAMSYHRAPSNALEQSDTLLKWAQSSYAAAVRVKK